MSALQHFTNNLTQPSVPLLYDIPPQGIRSKEQPTRPLVRTPRPSGVIQDAYWQKLNREVPSNRATKGLEEAYVIEDRSAVGSFIEENRLRGLLSEAVGFLNASFGRVSIKTLRLMRDDEGFQALFCLIRIPGDMQEARRALQEFDEQWWLTHCERAVGMLNFDFELV